MQDRRFRSRMPAAFPRMTAGMPPPDHTDDIDPTDVRDRVRCEWKAPQNHRLTQPLGSG